MCALRLDLNNVTGKHVTVLNGERERVPDRWCCSAERAFAEGSSSEMRPPCRSVSESACYPFSELLSSFVLFSYYKS